MMLIHMQRRRRCCLHAWGLSSHYLRRRWGRWRKWGEAMYGVSDNLPTGAGNASGTGASTCFVCRAILLRVRLRLASVLRKKDSQMEASPSTALFCCLGAARPFVLGTAEILDARGRYESTPLTCEEDMRFWWMMALSHPPNILVLLHLLSPYLFVWCQVMTANALG